MPTYGMNEVSESFCEQTKVFASFSKQENPEYLPEVDAKYPTVVLYSAVLHYQILSEVFYRVVPIVASYRNLTKVKIGTNSQLILSFTEKNHGKHRNFSSIRNR